MKFTPVVEFNMYTFLNKLTRFEFLAQTASKPTTGKYKVYTNIYCTIII